MSIKEKRSKGMDYTFAVNLMQFLVVPTFVLDRTGKVIIWNRACERLTDLPAVEVLGTKDHWRGFYDTERPCLADLVLSGQLSELGSLYVVHGDVSAKSYGVSAENWCVMPRHGAELYLAIDVGPIYDADGELLAVVETLRDMTAQRLAQSKLEQMANHDGLTSVFNRRGFDEKLHVEWARAKREKSTVALILIDVDYFKVYNDTYGHQAGDECLKRIASALGSAVLRPTDMVARYGGEEFAVILPGVDEGGALLVAERLRQSIVALGIAHSGNDARGHVTVSLGVAIALPELDMAHTELIQRADEALYQSKHEGRNRTTSRLRA